METDEVKRSPGGIFRRRMQEARKARNMTQRALVARLAEIGQEMNQAAIARIESGERKVSLDEAIAIAAALDVAPVHMFLPIEGDAIEGDEGRVGRGRRGPAVRLAPALEVDQVKARRWARGQIPLDPASFGFYLDQTPGDVAVSSEEMTKEEQHAFHDKWVAKLRQAGVNVQIEGEE